MGEVWINPLYLTMGQIVKPLSENIVIRKKILIQCSLYSLKYVSTLYNHQSGDKP